MVEQKNKEDEKMINEDKLDTEQKIILALTKTIKSIQEQNLKVHKRLLLESETNVKLYTSILSELRRQNLILEDAKQERRLVNVSNAIV